MISQDTYRLWKERFAILMVVVFCALVSGADYLVHHAQVDEVNTHQTAADAGDTDRDDKHATFVHNAVDAVVPFVMVAVDHVLHFIYEIATPRKPQTFFSTDFIQLPNNFLEVLFEHIVSANAP
ncbi:hypothetical protein [Lunatimonas salinarum]|uniref:hypothetical protein n=1 Tax=Lunatimonas salinarum TaxID=1774590 RepID=UPI001AE0AB7D|nr:hypothetical protein [Lunatimonas salinarum]